MTDGSGVAGMAGCRHWGGMAVAKHVGRSCASSQEGGSGQCDLSVAAAGRLAGRAGRGRLAGCSGHSLRHGQQQQHGMW